MDATESRQMILQSILRKLGPWLSDRDRRSAPALAELGEKPKGAEPPGLIATSVKRANINGCC
jgi:hypothetical protein